MRPISFHISLRLLDAVILLAPLIMGLVITSPWVIFHNANTLYVSPGGSDWNTGSTTTAALATIQRAADLARPGDRIQIAAGTYYERLHLRRGGTAEQPVILVAETPGSVIITGARPDNIPAEWRWRDEGDGIFSTATHSPVYRLQHGEATCFRLPWGGLAVLRKMVGKPGAASAFCQEHDRLYVHVKGRKHPDKENLITHRPAPAPREWGEFKSATIWVEADYLRLEGLQIDFGIGAAVNVWNAEHVEIRDCLFSGSTFGVKCTGGVKPARDLKLVNCLYHNYPQYDWQKNWLTWGEVYMAYASSTLIESADAPLTVENCLVTHAGDALRISPRAGQGSASAIIDGNYLAFFTDDAMEFDGDGTDIDVRHNLVYEGHQNLGFSPVEQGPITVEQNLFAHSPTGINGSQIKLINNLPGSPIRNINLRENAFVGDWLCWYNDAPMNDVFIQQNRFFIRRTADPPWPPHGVVVGENQVEILPVPRPPDQILAEWYDGANKPAWVRNVLKRHPGPTWFHAEDHPATKEAVRWRTQLQHRLQIESAIDRN